MEIKQGDKVRVSKDAPKMYYPKEQDGIVMEIEGEDAFIKNESGSMPHCSPSWVLAIPTKYLIKVDAEAKEAKFKVGDWVKIDETLNPQLNGRVGIISRIDKEDYKISFNDGFFTIVSEEDLTLVDEPTEAEKKANEELQEEYALFMSGRTPITLADRIERAHIQRRMRTISKDDFLKETNPAEHEGAFIRQMEAELDEFRKAELDRVLHPEKYHTYDVTIDNVAMDWQHYEADLAKEVAVKVANKYNYPEQAAEYAVKVAKAVVGNLKKK